MHYLTGFQRDLLYVIADLGEPTGVAIRATLEEYYQTDIRHGRVYRIWILLLTMAPSTRACKTAGVILIHLPSVAIEYSLLGKPGKYSFF